MQRAPPFVRRGQKTAAWLNVTNLYLVEPDLTYVTDALCETRYREARKEYENLQNSYAFQAVGIDIRDQATEENPHRAIDSRPIKSEVSQDPIVLSGVEFDDNGGVQIIQRRQRKRRKIHQNTEATEALLEAAKLFKMVVNIYTKKNQANIWLLC
ncbi:hypothetical protein FBU30_004117 [Linnemannia zychae]|nr:hypothetical protein FBU30_004117 [Linnemannia zychae]